LVTFRRAITKTAGSDGKAFLTLGDLYNLFGGASFTFKVMHIRAWTLSLVSGTTTFDLANSVFLSDEDNSVISYADVGNGAQYPAVHFSIPPALEKTITPTSGSTTVVVDAQTGLATTKVAYEVTAQFRL